VQGKWVKGKSMCFALGAEDQATLFWIVNTVQIAGREPLTARGAILHGCVLANHGRRVLNVLDFPFAHIPFSRLPLPVLHLSVKTPHNMGGDFCRPCRVPCRLRSFASPSEAHLQPLLSLPAAAPTIPARVRFVVKI
jgi:hypothetical protein